MESLVIPYQKCWNRFGQLAQARFQSILLATYPWFLFLSLVGRAWGGGNTSTRNFIGFCQSSAHLLLIDRWIARSAVMRGSYVFSRVNRYAYTAAVHLVCRVCTQTLASTTIKYGMPIHYDTIEDKQNKKSHLLFSNWSFLQVVRIDDTSDRTFDALMNFTTALGKTPVKCKVCMVPV